MGKLMLVIEDDQRFEVDNIDPEVYDSSDEEDLFEEYDYQISDYLSSISAHLEYEEEID